MSGFFITGTDTGVGKTLVSVALTRAFVAAGNRTAVMKPVAAGTVKTVEGEFSDDALELLAASNVKAPYEDVNPWLLRAAASPHLAARAEGVSIRQDRIASAYARLAAASDVVVVEGAGGWFAPISSVETMADVAQTLGLPVILVVGVRLGCLNHALLTHDAILSRGMKFAGWIANCIDPNMSHASENVETLESRFQRRAIARFPFDRSSSPELDKALVDLRRIDVTPIDATWPSPR